VKFNVLNNGSAFYGANPVYWYASVRLIQNQRQVGIADFAVFIIEYCCLVASSMVMSGCPSRHFTSAGTSSPECLPYC
jgi:hypothetical protein